LSGQIEHVEAVFAAGSPEYVPSPQSVHNADPIASFHCPASHALHALPSAPVYPVLHVQAVMMPLPITDTVLLGQFSHVAAAVAATAVENVCTPQLVHAAGPGSTLNLPAEQPEQELSPVLSHSVVMSTPCTILFWI
jgi:hypothetical protein